ncbi:MAG: Lrp/AsnC family transcriptional regulator [Clostridia bacterium]|nr:Lrp/AsnC family transcriptional regulator [Clostridia bacterium]
MTDLSKRVLKLLCENARYSYAEMADILGEKEAAVKSAVEELEKSKTVVKYAAILNTEVLPEKNVQALIEVKVAPQKLKGFESCAEEIYNFPEVQSLYLMSGGFDLAVFVEDKDICAIAKFVAEKLSVLDGIVGVATHFILKKYKIEGQITRPAPAHKREIIQA